MYVEKKQVGIKAFTVLCIQRIDRDVELDCPHERYQPESTSRRQNWEASRLLVLGRQRGKYSQAFSKGCVIDIKHEV